MLVKRQIIEGYIYPVVSYGLECATWTKALTRKIEVFTNDLMRKVCNVNLMDKVKIEDLRIRTKFNPLMNIIKLKKFQLFSKIKSGNSSKNLSKICLEGMVEGKRSRGKPKRRWIEDIKEWSGEKCIHMATRRLNETLQNLKQVSNF